MTYNNALTNSSVVSRWRPQVPKGRPSKRAPNSLTRQGAGTGGEGRVASRGVAHLDSRTPGIELTPPGRKERGEWACSFPPCRISRAQSPQSCERLKDDLERRERRSDQSIWVEIGPLGHWLNYWPVGEFVEGKRLLLPAVRGDVEQPVGDENGKEMAQCNMSGVAFLADRLFCRRGDLLFSPVPPYVLRAICRSARRDCSTRTEGCDVLLRLQSRPPPGVASAPPAWAGAIQDTTQGGKGERNEDGRCQQTQHAVGTSPGRSTRNRSGLVLSLCGVFLSCLPLSSFLFPLSSFLFPPLACPAARTSYFSFLVFLCVLVFPSSSLFFSRPPPKPNRQAPHGCVPDWHCVIRPFPLSSFLQRVLETWDTLRRKCRGFRQTVTRKYSLS